MSYTSQIVFFVYKLSLHDEAEYDVNQKKKEIQT